LSRDTAVLPARFIRKRNEPYLPLPSQPQLVLIYRPWGTPEGWTAGRLDYCNDVMYGAAKTTIQRLQTVMNAAARLVGGLGKYDHVTPVLRNTLHWLPIQQRIEFKVAVLAFDCVRGTCPSYFCGICTSLTEVGGRVMLHSAHHGDLCVPSSRTEFGKHSFRVAAPRTWNSLPLHLRSPTISRQQFQSGLKTHLFKRAYI